MARMARSPQMVTGDYVFRGRCEAAIEGIEEILRGSTPRKEATQGDVWILLQEGFQAGLHRQDTLADDPVVSGWWALARKAYNNPSSSGLRHRAETIAHHLTTGYIISENEGVFFREYLTHCRRPGADINAWKATNPQKLEQAMQFKASYEGGQPDQQPDTQEESKEEMFLKAQAVRTIKGWVGQVHKYENGGYHGESLIVWESEPIEDDRVTEISDAGETKKSAQQLAIDEANAKIDEVIAKLFQS